MNRIERPDPGEEGRQAREGEEPVEDISAVGRQVDECETSKEELKDDDCQRTALLVDVSQELGCHAWCLMSVSDHVPCGIL